MNARRTKRGKDFERPGGGRADLERMMAMSEEEIERTSPPELANLPPEIWDDAVMVYPEPKQPISLRVDQDVLDWFKQQGPRYQTRMNAVLRSYMRSRSKRGG